MSPFQGSCLHGEPCNGDGQCAACCTQTAWPDQYNAPQQVHVEAFAAKLGGMQQWTQVDLSGADRPDDCDGGGYGHTRCPTRTYNLKQGDDVDNSMWTQFLILTIAFASVLLSVLLYGPMLFCEFGAKNTAMTRVQQQVR